MNDQNGRISISYEKYFPGKKVKIPEFYSFKTFLEKRTKKIFFSRFSRRASNLEKNPGFPYFLAKFPTYTQGKIFRANSGFFRSLDTKLYLS